MLLLPKADMDVLLNNVVGMVKLVSRTNQEQSFICSSCLVQSMKISLTCSSIGLENSKLMIEILLVIKAVHVELEEDCLSTWNLSRKLLISTLSSSCSTSVHIIPLWFSSSSCPWCISLLINLCFCAESFLLLCSSYRIMLGKCWLPIYITDILMSLQVRR
jgi:hypothetical protein